MILVILGYWLAIVLYNCDNEGLLIGSILYWNGTHTSTETENQINQFCENIAANITCTRCAFDNPINDITCSSSSSDLNVYPYFWLDQDGTSCPLLSFQTTNPAQFYNYPTDLLSIPNCTAIPTNNDS